MGRYGTRSIVALALVLIAAGALADQGAPAYVSQDPNNPPTGACSGTRVQIDNETGFIYACIASAWTKVGTLSAGAGLQKGDGTGKFTAATSGVDYAPATSGTNLLKGNGSGGFTAYAGTTACTNQAMTALSAAGVATCTSVGDVWLSALGAQKLTFADAATYTFGKTTPTSVTLNVGHNGSAALVNTFNIADHNHSATAGRGGQISYPDLTNKPTIPADISGSDFIVGSSSASLSAERVATDTTTVDVDLGTAGQAKWNVLQAPDLVCTDCITIGTEISPIVKADTALVLDSSAATSTTTKVDSPALRFTGSYWNGTSAVDKGWEVKLNWHGTDGSDPSLGFFPGADLGADPLIAFRPDGTINAVGLSVSGTASFTSLNVRGGATYGDTLPNCDSTRRGELVWAKPTAKGDELSACMMNSDGTTYGWVAIAISGK
jgi:hypothetical protein